VKKNKPPIRNESQKKGIVGHGGLSKHLDARPVCTTEVSPVEVSKIDVCPRQYRAAEVAMPAGKR
jgi:hypothetical protein